MKSDRAAKYKGSAMAKHHHGKVLILGSGPAGLTAAIYAARAALEPMLVHGIEPGGQMTITTDVENYPGFADVVQGPWLMDRPRPPPRSAPPPPRRGRDPAAPGGE